MRSGGDAGAGAPPPHGSERGEAELRFWGPLLAALGAGAVLRLVHLDAQVLGGDELHALAAASGESAAELLAFRTTDHCIPLSLLYHGLLEVGVRLGESEVRAPMVVSGLLLLGGAPLAARAAFGRGTAVIFAWLLAISPPLVLYTRIARPYAPMVLLAWGAILAFARWRAHGGRLAAALYPLLGAGAIYFHLGAAPIVAAPLAWAGLRALAAKDSAGLLRTLGMAAALGVATALPILPAWPSFWELLSSKSNGALLSGEPLLRTLALQAGTGSWAVAALFWALAVGGAGALLRRERARASFVLVLVGAHVASFAVMQPRFGDVPIVANRYLLVALPGVLLCVAFALERLRARAPAWVGAPSIVLVLLLLFASGPLARAEYYQSPFVHHSAFLSYDPAAEPLEAPSIPAVYERLREADAPGPVLELPWTPVWDLGRSLVLYQRLHRREVVVAPVPRMLEDPRLELRNLAPPEPAALRRSRARFAVLHRSLMAEEMRVGGRRMYDARAMRRRALEALQPLRRVGSRLEARLRRAWGPPRYEGERVLAWDLEAVRRRHGEQREASGSRSDAGS